MSKPKLDDIQRKTESLHNFQTDTYTIKITKITVYRYLNKNYLKDSDLKLSVMEYENFRQKTIHNLSYLQTLFKKCIVMVETFHHNWFNVGREVTFFS